MMRSHLDRNFEPEVLRLLGEALIIAGEPAAAKETIGSALDICRAQGARLFELKLVKTLAQVLERRGDRAEARRVLDLVARASARDPESSREADLLLERALA